MPKTLLIFIAFPLGCWSRSPVYLGEQSCSKLGILHINYSPFRSDITRSVGGFSPVSAQEHRTGSASAELLAASMRSRKDSFGRRVAHGGPVVRWSFRLGALNESNSCFHISYVWWQSWYLKNTVLFKSFSCLSAVLRSYFSTLD